MKTVMIILSLDVRNITFAQIFEMLFCKFSILILDIYVYCTRVPAARSHRVDGIPNWYKNVRLKRVGRRRKLSQIGRYMAI